MRIILLVFYCLISTSLMSQNTTKIRIDSSIKEINLSTPKLKFTFSPGKSSKKADSIEYYYVNEGGHLVKFENANTVNAKFGNLMFLSQSTFYFENDRLIKVEIRRSFPDGTKSFNEFYISQAIKYSKSEKRFGLELIKKSNSIVKAFYKSQ
jgi:hypothetical protein